MSTTAIQRGDVLTLTAPGGGFTAGVAVAVSSLVVVPKNTAASGVLTDCDVEGVHTLAKATGATWSEGQVLYFDTSTANFKTATNATAFRAGVATAAAASGDTTGKVRLCNISAAVNVA